MDYPKISSPFLHSGASVTKVMGQLLIALLPGAAVYVWFFGPGHLANILVACAVALMAEAFVLVIRKMPVAFHLTDGSALVTATLFAIGLPPLTPWWLTAIGTSFAIIIVKHLFGGLGQNVFNPAMAGYAMVLLAYPKEMTAWITPNGLRGQDVDTGGMVLSGIPDTRVDSVTQATPLDALDIQLGLQHELSTILNEPLFGQFAGFGWEWINLAFLAGGLWLIYKRIISWHIPAGFTGGLFVIAGLFYWIDPGQFASPLFHLFNGATMIGAFFIATDPVTAPATARGKIIFAAGAAFIAYFIRLWGAYPDGIAFGVLLMNMVTPMLDQLTQPRVYGHPK